MATDQSLFEFDHLSHVYYKFRAQQIAVSIDAISGIHEVEMRDAIDCSEFTC